VNANGQGGFRFTVDPAANNSPWYQVVATLPVPFLLDTDTATVTGAGNGIENEIPGDSNSNSFIALHANGSAALTIPFGVPSAAYYVEFSARATEYKGPADVYIDVSGSPTNNAAPIRIPDVLGGSWQRYLVSSEPVTVGSGQVLKFTFTDSTGNREVMIDDIRLYRASLQPHGDADQDAIANSLDNCLDMANLNQTDTDSDGQGDVCDADMDGDGLANTEEATYGTDALSPDTDGDGYRDGTEVSLGSDPLNGNSTPTIMADGDISLDGQVNAADVLLATRTVLALTTLTAEQIAHGDFRPTPAGDGQIALEDLLLVTKAALGIP
jgi:hypothetical protein